MKIARLFKTRNTIACLILERATVTPEISYQRIGRAIIVPNYDVWTNWLRFPTEDGKVILNPDGNPSKYTGEELWGENWPVRTLTIV